MRDDLAQINTPGVGLDDYETLGAAYPATGYFFENVVGPGQWCTGTIVNYSPITTFVLTAAHCIAGFDANNNKIVTAAEAPNLSFQLGNNGNLNGAGIGIVNAWYMRTVPNNFQPGVRSDDVAIVEINANAAHFGNVISPVAYAPFADVDGRQSDFVGWGNQGTGLAAGAGGPPTSVTDGFGYTARDKLGAQNIIDSNHNGLLVTDFDDPGNANGVNPLGGAFPLNFEGTTAMGDSGGPLIPVGGPAAGRIVGVLSGGLNGLQIANCVANSLYDDCSAWAPLATNKVFVKLRAGFNAGDFNDDGFYDLLDIDALTTAIATGGSLTDFDLNDDGTLSLLDVNSWLAEAGAVNISRPYLSGDLNLDGQVDASDFLGWNANKFTVNSNWSSGDFTADGVVDAADFLSWNANKFTTADLMNTVPEPSLGFMWAVGLWLTTRFRWSRPGPGLRSE